MTNRGFNDVDADRMIRDRAYTYKDMLKDMGMDKDVDGDKSPLEQGVSEEMSKKVQESHKKTKEKAAKNDFKAGSTLEDDDYATYDQTAYDYKGNVIKGFQGHEETGPVLKDQNGRPYSEIEGSDKVIFWSSKTSSGSPASPTKQTKSGKGNIFTKKGRNQKLVNRHDKLTTKQDESRAKLNEYGTVKELYKNDRITRRKKRTEKKMERRGVQTPKQKQQRYVDSPGGIDSYTGSKTDYAVKTENGMGSHNITPKKSGLKQTKSGKGNIFTKKGNNQRLVNKHSKAVDQGNRKKASKVKKKLDKKGVIFSDNRRTHNTTDYKTVSYDPKDGMRTTTHINPKGKKSKFESLNIEPIIYPAIKKPKRFL